MRTAAALRARRPWTPRGAFAPSYPGRGGRAPAIPCESRRRRARRHGSRSRRRIPGSWTPSRRADDELPIGAEARRVVGAAVSDGAADDGAGKPEPGHFPVDRRGAEAVLVEVDLGHAGVGDA